MARPNVGDLIPIGAIGNAKKGDVLQGKTYSSDEGVDLVGTMPNRGAINETITTQNGQITIPQGYHNGSGIVKAQFANLVPENIKQGVNVGGVVGTLVQGLEYKSGTVVSGSSLKEYTMADGTKSEFYTLQASGLNLGFTPRYFIAKGTYYSVTYLVFYAGRRITSIREHNTPSDNQAYVFNSTTSVYVDSAGFSVPTKGKDVSFTWIAIK